VLTTSVTQDPVTDNSIDTARPIFVERNLSSEPGATDTFTDTEQPPARRLLLHLSCLIQPVSSLTQLVSVGLS